MAQVLHNEDAAEQTSVALSNAKHAAYVSPANNNLLPAIFTNGLLSKQSLQIFFINLYQLSLLVEP